MALKAKCSDIDKSFDDEDSKMKSYIIKQFKKFMKNANGKGFNKDSKQSNSSQFKSQDKGKKDARDGGQYTIPSGPKWLGYDFSSPSIASTSATVFVPPANNIETDNNVVKDDLASENIDKGKSILGAPPKQDKKEVKNPRAKKANSQKPKQKK